LKTRKIAAALLAALVLAACLESDVPVEVLFPGQVGEYLRTSGPSPHASVPGVELAVYQGPSGTVTLQARRVDAGQAQAALNTLPPLATNVGYDPALGQREGVFFTFGEEYHAAWANGDWVFVLSASTEAGRAAFLSAYGY